MPCMWRILASRQRVLPRQREEPNRITLQSLRASCGGRKEAKMFLDDTELMKLTGKARPKAQQRALNKMGVPFRVRADGHTLVLQSAVDAHFNSTPEPARAKVFRLNIANA